MNFKHLLCILVLGLSTVASAQKYKSAPTSTITKDWQEIVFTSGKSLKENLAQSPSFSFMTEILNDEVLAKQLRKQEMVTVFVANDASFLALDKATRDALLADTPRLSQLVKFHTIPGRVDSDAIEKAISTSGGIAYFITLNGKKLAATQKEGVLTLSDDQGNTAIIKDTDFYHKNGFFHMVEGFAFATEKKE
tara:strand:- start:25313 stop:25891 length:579 start_codon:yes stop_codon:yes gene_type:complete